MSKIKLHRIMPAEKLLAFFCSNPKLNHKNAQELIVKHNININKALTNTRNGRYYYITHAAQFGNWPMVKLLINRGADIEVRDKNGFTAIQLAALARGDYDDIIISRINRTAHMRVVTELLIKDSSADAILAAKLRCGPYTPMHDHINNIEAKIKNIYTKKAISVLPDEIIDKIKSYLPKNKNSRCL